MGKTLPILVVDDDESVRSLLQDLLSADYQVRVASDCFEATEMLTAHRFSLLITDLLLPVFDGVEFIQLLRSTPKFDYLPVLILTVDRQKAALLSSVRVERILYKPCALDDIVRAVEELTQWPSSIIAKNAENGAQRKGSRHGDSAPKNADF